MLIKSDQLAITPLRQPGSRLQGASVKGVSFSGSAAAPVSEPRGAVLMAPAKMTPRPISARRCSRPLPATASKGEDLILWRRKPEMLMVSSLLAQPVGARDSPMPVFRGFAAQYAPPCNCLATKFETGEP